MKISHKLIGSFIGISLLTGVVGIVAVVQGHKIAETLSITEAQNLAQSISLSITTHQENHGDSLNALNPEELQELQSYIAQMHQLQNRDVEVVNQEGRIIADAVPDDIGKILENEESREVRQTLKDGMTRIFVEKNDEYPQGIKLVAVPLKTSQNQIIGAVILEWSSLYDSAMLQARPTLLIISLTSLGCVALAILLGLHIARQISRPLQSVTTVAQQVTQDSNFDLQAPVISRDETGTLANAMNNLIRQVKNLLNEKEERTEELKSTLNQLRSTQLQLVQTEKMSSLGQLVAGLAHEINNPVNFIHGNISHVDNYAQDLVRVTQSYQTHYPNPPATLRTTLDEVELDFLYEDLRKLLHSMKIGTERIRQIILSLRNFSRLDESEFKAVDLHEGIDNTLLILQHRLKAKSGAPVIEVVKEFGSLPLVECYPGQLNQVLMNLLTNAIDALQDMPPTQTPEAVSTQPPTIWISTQVISKESVQITIADNGCGMPETVRSRIFDPFFTTKPIGKGTGLGLSISHQIVTEKHNGQIGCDSILGEGTKFVIEIPLRQSVATAS